jgi:hypothetical protein
MSDHTQDDLNRCAAQVAAGLMARGWAVRREEALLSCGIGDIYMLRLQIQPKDLHMTIAELVTQAHGDLLTVSKGRNIVPVKPHAPAPEERVISASQRQIRDAKNRRAARSGRLGKGDGV